MNDYERIARIIRYLDAHQAEQPTLSELAKCVGLSMHHFQRLFSTWAGVTPKQFLECLTMQRARQLLGRGQTVLDAALGAGLSGPGRLHDLSLKLEAASPGEIRQGGAGWTVPAGFAPSPFGTCLIAESPRGLCHLSFIDESAPVRGRAGNERDRAWRRLEQEWPKARFQRDDRAAGELARRIFQTGNILESGSPATLRLLLKGTAFQLRVWRALVQVLPGELTSYGRLASAIGEPTAARAVGSAVGRNRIAYLIPCHRVIRETGLIGDYRWGQLRKRALVAWERARASG